MQYDSYSVGEYGRTVRVYRRKPGGAFQVEIAGRSKALRPPVTDRRAAILYATTVYREYVKGLAAIRDGAVTLETVFAAYMQEHSRHKTPLVQATDRFRRDLWLAYLGGTTLPGAITLREWEAFIRDRSRGCLGRQPVRPRTVQADCQWLRHVLRWATNWRMRDGQYLLPENPVRGYPLPADPNPRRPVAVEGRYQAVLAVAGPIGYLADLLPILNGTGRRLSAVLQLRFADLRLDEGPHGAICWPAVTDKLRRQTTVPIGPDVRAAIDRILRARPGIGEAWLFPAPKRKGQPVDRWLATRWMRRAEDAAGLPKLDGSLFHALRRKWATERKHLPAVDVAAAGGWKNARTLQTVYQAPDSATLLAVVLGGGTLVEVAQ